MPIETAKPMTEAEAAALIPVGRRPYRAVRLALRELGSQDSKDDRIIGRTITTVTDAHINGLLDPPLSDELGEAIIRMNNDLIRDDEIFRGRHHHNPVTKAGALVLEAIYEHGYGRVNGY